MKTFKVDQEKYNEYEDRIGIIINMCDDLLLHHPVASAEKEVRETVDSAVELLIKAKQSLINRN